MLARTLLAALLAAGFAGCLFDTRVAGGAQDFPNTIAPLGKTSADNIAGHSEWDQFSNIPSALPSLKAADSLELTAGPGGGSAGAQPLPASGREPAPDTTWDFSDTATLAVARRFIYQETLLKIKTDTAVFRYDQRFKDGVAGNELALESKGAEAWKSGLRLHFYRYLNIDSAGGFDKGAFLLRLKGLDDVYKYQWLTVTAGPDGDISAKADNRPAHYAFARMRGTPGTASANTLEGFEIIDADGDGTLWAGGDSGLVEFRQKTPAPALRPAVQEVVQKMRAVLFKEESRTYPVSFWEQRTEKDGKRVTFSMRGRRADSSFAFDPGDTAVVSVNVRFPADHPRMAERHSRYRVILPARPKDYALCKLIDFTMETEWREKLVLSTRLSFVPDSLVPAKEISLAGKIGLEAVLADGRTGSLTGRFQDNRFKMLFIEKGATGPIRKFRVHWNALGEVLLQEKAD